MKKRKKNSSQINNNRFKKIHDLLKALTQKLAAVGLLNYYLKISVLFKVTY